MKLAYMENETAEAQAALAKKHTMMQDAVDKAEELENTLTEEREVLLATKSMVSTLKTQMQAQEQAAAKREAELQSDIQGKAAQIEEGGILLAARKATETKLHAEAAALVETLDASVADGQRMFGELKKRASEEQTKREAAQAFFVQSSDALDSLNAEVAVYSAEAVKKQQAMTTLAKDAVDAGKVEAKKIEVGMSELLKMIQNTAAELQQTVMAQCETSSTELSAAVAAQADSVKEMVEAFAASAQSMTASLDDTAAKIKAGDADLKEWGNTGLERLAAADASLTSMTEEAASTLTDTQTSLSVGLAAHQARLGEHHTAINLIATALETHKANETNLTDTLQANERQASESITQHLELLKAQNAHVVEVLETHRTGQLDQEQLQTLASMSAAINDGANKHSEMLTAQKEGLQRAVDNQTAGNASDEHTQLLASLHEMLSNATSAQIDTMCGQHEELTGSLKRQQDGNACAAHSEQLASAKELVSGNIASEQTLLATQRSGLDAAVADLRAEETDKSEVLRKLAESEQKIQEDTSAQVVQLKDQEAKVAQQQEQLAEMLAAQQAAQAELIQTVMSSVEAMLREQMGKLGSSFEERAAQIQSTTTALGEDNASVLAQISSMKQEVDVINSSAAELTEDWGVKVQTVAGNVAGLADENAAISSHMTEASGAYAATSQQLIEVTENWGAENDAVAESIQNIAAVNEAVVARIESASRSHAEQTTALTENAQAWGISNCAVAASVTEMLELNGSIQTEVATTRASFEALNETGTSEVQAWGDNGRSVGESMGHIIKENDECQNDSAATQAASTEAAAAAHASCLELTASTAAVMDSVASLRGATESSKTELQEVEGAAATGLTSSTAAIASLGEHQAAMVAVEVSQVERLLSSRPAVVEEMEISCAAINSQLAGSKASLEVDTAASHASLTRACASNGEAWSGFASKHNGTCSEVDDETAVWNSECLAIVASEIERLSGYEEAQCSAAEDANGDVAKHSAEVVESSESREQGVRAFCNTTLEMEAAVPPPAAMKELPAVARSPMATPSDAVLLADCRTQWSSAPTAATAAAAPVAVAVAVAVVVAPKAAAAAEGGPTSPVATAIQNVAKTNAVLASPATAKKTRPRAAGKIVAPGSSTLAKADVTSVTASVSASPAIPAVAKGDSKLAQGKKNPFAPVKANTRSAAAKHGVSSV